MIINYETAIVIIYLIVTITSFYPIIYQLITIRSDEVNHEREVTHNHEKKQE